MDMNTGRSLLSLHIAKLIRPLALASAALVIHIGGATAADSKGDVQEQIREVLTGPPSAHFAPQSEPRDGKVTTRTVDPQEFVRQILLGTVASRVGDAEAIKHSEVTAVSGKTEAQKRPVAYGDMQVAVRQVLSGQHRARDAS
jgi:hypothetical protein